MRHTPRKRFGQHFLRDSAVIYRIVDVIDPRPGQSIIEIGPGLGAMTQPLLNRSKQLTVIELDRDLAARLRQQPALQVIEADVLNVDFGTLHKGPLLRVVGNLPYNISTPILFHLLKFVDHIEDQHFMLQHEVVERMCADPCSKDYGRLSVMLQWRYQMENMLHVPPEAFDPPPRVESAIVRMQPMQRWPGLNAALLSEMVTVAFSQRRKILRHTLGPWLELKGFTGPFDLQRRAEEIPVKEYAEITCLLQG